MVIRHAKRPRSFGGKYVNQLGLDYHANKKAWMTPTVLFEWMSCLNRLITRTPNRKILVFIHNCRVHECVENILILSNVDVFFLLPNNTSQVQPLDAEIIAQVMVEFKYQILLRIFENIEGGKKPIYNIGTLTIIKWILEE